MQSSITHINADGDRERSSNAQSNECHDPWPAFGRWRTRRGLASPTQESSPLRAAQCHLVESVRSKGRTRQEMK